MKFSNLPLAALALAFLTAAASADMRSCIDATCRIETSSGVGTGCIFDATATHYLVLTNAHVTSQGPGGVVRCRFWHRGFASDREFKGVVLRTWYGFPARYRDISVVAVERSQLGAVPMPVIPLADRGSELPVVITSVGCADGGWPTSWTGHTTSVDQESFTFAPGPKNGRSGSAIFDEHGTRIVGLVATRTADGSGRAMLVREIYRAFDGQQQMQTKAPSGEAAVQAWSTLPEVQWGPGGGCSPGGGNGFFGGGFGFGGGSPQPPPGTNPWPATGGTLPGRDGGPYNPWTGGVPETAGPTGLEAQLSGLTARVTKLESAQEQLVSQVGDTSGELERTYQTTNSRFAKVFELIDEKTQGLASRIDARVAELKAEAQTRSFWTGVAQSLGLGGPTAVVAGLLMWLAYRRLSRRLGHIAGNAGNDNEQPGASGGARHDPFRTA